MITYSQWDAFCLAIRDTGVSTMLAREFAARERVEQEFVIIKHDIEAAPRKALQVAQIESKNGIYATYYFHGFFLRDPDSVRCMQQLMGLGHEIGYHYDVLDRNDGDFAKALREFESDIAGFAEIGAEIATVCPHGNPLKQRSGWNSNKDFFKDESIRARFPKIFDIVNDMLGCVPSLTYISDAGFKFNVIGDIRDNDKANDGFTGDKEISPEDILNIVSRGPATVISVHSHRMAATRFVLFLRETAFLTLRGVARMLAKLSVFRHLLSVFYTISKRL